MTNKVLPKSATYPSPIIPALKDGSKLAIKEFHRRYETTPKEVNAELIKGVMRLENKDSLTHAVASAKIIGFLGIYSFITGGTNLVNQGTYFTDGANEIQPACVLRIESKFGGKSWVNIEDFLEGAPELIAEIVTVGNDLTDKIEIYEQKGVQELIVWRVSDKKFDWLSLKGGKYQNLQPNKSGIIKSKVFVGLRLNVEALLNNELEKVFRDLQKGIKSKKYKEFAKKLIK